MGQEAPPNTLRTAEDIYQSRRRRNSFFDGGKLFGEPAYDIMLDLFIAAHRGREVSVTSACIAADVPPTTALRHLSALQKYGWIVRTADPNDRRRSNLELSEAGFRKMDAWLRATPAGRGAAPAPRNDLLHVACTVWREGKRITLRVGDPDVVSAGFSLTMDAARHLRQQLDDALNETPPRAANPSSPASS